MPPSPQHSSPYMLGAPDERETVATNLTDRLRMILDIMHLPPPPPIPLLQHSNSAPGGGVHAPKPLFGTRPPPAALARGFSVGGRDRSERERQRSELEAPMGADASAAALRPVSPGAASSANPYSSALDGPAPSLFPPGRRQGREGPLCAGWLSMQKKADKWKRFWCEFSADGVFSYRVDDTTKKALGSIQVTYAEAELTQLPASQLSPARFNTNTNGTTPAEGGVDAASDSLSRLQLDRSSTAPTLGGILPAIPSASSSSTASSAHALVPAHLLASAQPVANKFSEQYFRHLEEEHSFWCFKILSPARAFLFRADNPGSIEARQAAAAASSPAGSVCGEELRNLFVLTIRTYLQQAFGGGPAAAPLPASGSSSSLASLPALNFQGGGSGTSVSSSPVGGVAGGGESLSRNPSPPPNFGTPPSSLSHIWRQKNELFPELLPLLHEQSVIQTSRAKALQIALAKVAGVVEDELPITSVRKEKSGVLAMEHYSNEKDAKPSAAASSSAASSSAAAGSAGSDELRWRDYYFVLFEGALFYYKDSKSTTPTGFITLRYASLVVQPARLARKEYVFHVVTPCRTICCKTKHPVALSEWISVLEHTLSKYARDNPAAPLTLPATLMFGAPATGGISQALPPGAQASIFNTQTGNTHTFNRDGSLQSITAGGGPSGSPRAGGSGTQGLPTFGVRSTSLGNLATGNGALALPAGSNGSGGSNPTTPQRGKSSSLDQTPGSAQSAAGVGGGGAGASGAGQPSAPGSASKSSSMTVLQNINRWINNVVDLSSPLLSFQGVVQHPAGLEHFRRALAAKEEEANGRMGGPQRHLDFYIATQEFINLFQASASPSVSESSALASQIFQRFLVPPTSASAAASSEFLSESSEDMRGIIEDQLVSPNAGTFDAVRALSIGVLHAEFAEFRRTPEFVALQEAMNASTSTASMEDRRAVAPWEPGMTQVFIIKVKGIKRSKEHALPSLKRLHEQQSSGSSTPAASPATNGNGAGGIIGPQGQGMTSIGRDKSNTLVIEDSRVSRSHARVEYTDTQCEYIDLGSSCGSKLNGKPVLRARLRPGDVVELGQSVLIFQLRRKKKSAVENFKASFVQSIQELIRSEAKAKE